jgi:hypothetical protein
VVRGTASPRPAPPERDRHVATPLDGAARQLTLYREVAPASRGHLVPLNRVGPGYGLVNLNGGAIAVGHPLGCSGARIVTTLLYEMRGRGCARGAATMCTGVGLGIGSLREAP